MTKYFYFLFAFAVISLTACQSKQGKADLASEIQSLEDSVFTADRTGFRPLQDENARLLIEKYEALAKTDVEEKRQIDALFLAVSLAQYNKSYAKAAQLLKKIYTKYPDSEGAIRAKFDEAYLYDDKIQDIDKARELYEAFLKEYPDTKYTILAEQSLSVLGKSLNDILKEAKEQAVENGEIVE